MGGNGCDGSFGGDTIHACVLNPTNNLILYDETYDQITVLLQSLDLGWYLTSIDGYSFNGQPRYAAIWKRSSIDDTKTVVIGRDWSNYQQVFDSYVAAGWMLEKIDGDGVGGYVSVWKPSSGIAWQSYHHMTEAQYLARFHELAVDVKYKLTY